MLIETFECDGIPYTITTYQSAKGYYAVWKCDVCGTTGMTERFATVAEAAERVRCVAMTDHHVPLHRSYSIVRTHPAPPPDAPPSPPANP